MQKIDKNINLDMVLKTLLEAGFEPADIHNLASKAKTELMQEKAEIERKVKEAAAQEEKIAVARDRAATTFADYLLTLGVEEAMGVSKEEAIQLAKDTFNDMEAEVQRTLNMMKRCRVAQDVDSDFDQAIAKFLKDIGALN